LRIIDNLSRRQNGGGMEIKMKKPDRRPRKTKHTIKQIFLGLLKQKAIDWTAWQNLTGWRKRSPGIRSRPVR
jgi:hypothetical protein